MVEMNLKYLGNLNVEVVHEPSGVEFEILDADPRRIKRLRARKLPKPQATDA